MAQRDASIDRNLNQNWSPETLLVHGGQLRTGFGETAEALFLTQSYVYETAEQAEARASPSTCPPTGR